MSRAALKKVLATLTAEQKDELILDLYSARKEAKDYLDFFVNPDINKLMDKAASAITKEAYRRGKHGYNKPKITNIRNTITSVTSLRPGEEYAIRIHFNAIQSLGLAAADGYWFTDAHIASYCRIMNEAIRLADSYGILDDTASLFQQFIDKLPSKYNSARYVKGKLDQSLRQCIAELASASDRPTTSHTISSL